MNINFKEWFLLQEAVTSILIANPRYPNNPDYDFLIVKGDTFQIKDILRNAGFRWFDRDKNWALARFTYNALEPSVKQELKDLGVEFDLFDKPRKDALTVKPYVQKPSEIQKTTETKTYYLATSKSLEKVPAGQPIVVYSDKNNWVYEDRDGNVGSIISSQVGNVIKRVVDKDGKPISGTSIQKLFKAFDDMPKTNSSLATKDLNVVDKGVSSDDESDQIKFKTKGIERPKPENVRIPAKNMTEYNTEIQNKFVDTKENIMIDALAGTGKTTMLKHLSSFIKPGEKWLYLVFNSKNQIESNRAFPRGVDVLTTHSFLGKILKENGKDVGGETQLPPEGQKWRKMWKIADRIISSDWPSIDGEFNYKNKKTGEMTSPFHYKAKRFTTKLVDLAKAYAINPNDENCKNKLLEIIKDSGMDTDVSTDRILEDRDYTPDMVEKAIEIMKLTMPLALNDRREEMANYRDQDDTLWYAALNADKIRWNPFKYDVVLLDEVQDFNECQLIMAQKLKEAGCRIIGVGDKFQGMYAFRGAYSKAFEKLKNIIGSGKSLTLPVNFRSGGKIINWVRSNTHVNSIKAAPHLEGKGEVYAENGTHPPMGYNNFLNMVTEEFNKNQMAKESTAFICRSNAPLGNAALHFLKNNIDFQIIGKDLSKDLIELIKKSTKNKPEYVRIEDYRDELEDYVKDQEDRYSGKISKSDELASLREFAGVLNSVHQYLESKQFKETEESSPITNVKEFQSYLERKLSGLDPDNPNDAAKIKSRDARKVVTLTTAHKSKGLEWERTFIMKPAGFNPEKPNIKTEEQKEQEKNAWYVAVTRGRNTLMISADDEPR